MLRMDRQHRCINKNCNSNQHKKTIYIPELAIVFDEQVLFLIAITLAVTFGQSGYTCLYVPFILDAANFIEEAPDIPF